MAELFKTTEILPLTSEPAFQLCTNSLQYSVRSHERTQAITCLLGFNTAILQTSPRMGQLSVFFQLGTTSLKPVNTPRSCGKQPLETAFCHLETKTSNITRWRELQFSLMKKRGKMTLLHAESIRSEERRVGKTRCSSKRIKKDCLGIFCCLQSYNLPRKI